MPWKREWQPTLVFLSGESHGQRSLVGYSPQGRKRVRHDLATKQQESHKIRKEKELGESSGPILLLGNPLLNSTTNFTKIGYGVSPTEDMVTLKGHRVFQQKGIRGGCSLSDYTYHSWHS